MIKERLELSALNCSYNLTLSATNNTLLWKYGGGIAHLSLIAHFFTPLSEQPNSLPIEEKLLVHIKYSNSSLVSKSSFILYFLAQGMEQNVCKELLGVNDSLQEGHSFICRTFGLCFFACAEQLNTSKFSEELLVLLPSIWCTCSSDSNHLPILIEAKCLCK
jgi:hypothetical protein